MERPARLLTSGRSPIVLSGGGAGAVAEALVAGGCSVRRVRRVRHVRSIHGFHGHAKQLGAGGGWRLPTKDELLSIVDKTRRNPAVNVVAFPNTPSQWFWSSSSDGGGTSIVHFGDGSTNRSAYTFSYHVRCVR